MGKSRLEVVGEEKQSDMEKGFQPYRKDIAIFEDLDDAVKACDAVAELYPRTEKVVVMDRKNGKWYNHHTVIGRAGEDKHTKKVPKRPVVSLVDKVKKNHGKKQAAAASN